MERVGIGIIGCGDIFPAYASNLIGVFSPMVELLACADILPDKAAGRAEEYGVQSRSVPELLADPDVELVVNLTIPQAHYDVSLSALRAGKHVFTEKPLAVTRDQGREIIDMAAGQGLRVGGAADTFLGAGLQACRHVLDSGQAGTPFAATAFLSMGVQTERYHKLGIGPMFDMAPYYLGALIALLGPVRRATGSAQIPFPRKPRPDGAGTFDVEAPTVVSGVMDFDSGCVCTVTTTCDGFGYTPRLEIYGTEGTLICNDPNAYVGPVILKPRNAEPREIPVTEGFRGRGRGLGVAEMAHALGAGHAPRASGQLMNHVLDIMQAVHDASRDGLHAVLSTSCPRPEPFRLEDILPG